MEKASSNTSSKELHKIAESKPSAAPVTQPLPFIRPSNLPQFGSSSKEKSGKHDGEKSRKHASEKSRKHTDDKSRKHADDKSRKHANGKSQKHADGKSRKHTDGKSRKHSDAAVPCTSNVKPSAEHPARASKESNRGKDANKVDGKSESGQPISFSHASTSESTLNLEREKNTQKRAEIWKNLLNKRNKKSEEQESQNVIPKERNQESAELGKKLLNEGKKKYDKHKSKNITPKEKIPKSTELGKKLLKERHEKSHERKSKSVSRKEKKQICAELGEKLFNEHPEIPQEQRSKNIIIKVMARKSMPSALDDLPTSNPSDVAITVSRKEVSSVECAAKELNKDEKVESHIEAVKDYYNVVTTVQPTCGRAGGSRERDLDFSEEETDKSRGKAVFSSTCGRAGGSREGDRDFSEEETDKSWGKAVFSPQNEEDIPTKNTENQFCSSSSEDNSQKRISENQTRPVLHFSTIDISNMPGMLRLAETTKCKESSGSLIRYVPQPKNNESPEAVCVSSESNLKESSGSLIRYVPQPKNNEGPEAVCVSSDSDTEEADNGSASGSKEKSNRSLNRLSSYEEIHNCSDDDNNTLPVQDNEVKSRSPEKLSCSLSSEDNIEMQLNEQIKNCVCQMTSSEVSTQTDNSLGSNISTRRIKGLTCLRIETMQLIELFLQKLQELTQAEEMARSVFSDSCRSSQEQTSSNSNLDGKTKQYSSRAVPVIEKTALHNDLPVSNPSDEARRSISRDIACQSSAEKSLEELNERETTEFQVNDKNNDCQIVAMLEPISKRSPVIISLLSDDETTTETNEQAENASENEENAPGLSVTDEQAILSSENSQEIRSNNSGRVSCLSSSGYNFTKIFSGEQSSPIEHLQHNISPSNIHETRPGKRRADVLDDCCSRHSKRRS